MYSGQLPVESALFDFLFKHILQENSIFSNSNHSSHSINSGGEIGRGEGRFRLWGTNRLRGDGRGVSVLVLVITIGYYAS
jgi:hypothetical protein